MAPDLRSRLQATLGSAYSLERELVGGGMAQVFVAMESRLGRRVVVKVLRPEIAAGTSAARFEREMAFCARCIHPHIIPLLTTGEVGGLPYFTMPLVEGESLRDRLTGGAIPIAETVRLLGEIADALAYAHRQGVVHRDIKPENILLQDGHALVADFGVAKALHIATQAGESGPQTTGVGTVIGTPAYMAPEQALGDPGVDHRADLYALGVVGYEMVIGHPPFTGGSVQALLTAQLTATPPSLSKLSPECPAALAALIDRLLAKEAGKRPQTGDEVVSTLRSIAASSGGARGLRSGVLVTAGILVAGVAVAYGLGLFRGQPAGNPAPIGVATVPSIAVLPFDNIGGDSTTNYFSDGISEELINALARLEGLRVASRTSAFAARARSEDLKAIGARLSVTVVLEGSVRRDGPRVRVTARLVDVARDSQLWVGEYENRLENVFAVQDTIARAIAGALKVTLTGGGAVALVARGTTNPEAHDLYLRGRYFLAVRNAVGLRKAIAAFKAALTLDSTYAPAYAGLADGYSLAVPFGGLSPGEAFPPAKAAAYRALALDSTLAEVHTSLGIIALFHDWDWAEANRQISRAIQLNPSSPQARLFHAWYLLLMGQPESALAEMERARQLDPLSLIINTRKATLLHFLGRDAEAIPAFTRALELDSTFAFAKAGLALSYAMVGRFEEALALKPDWEALLGNYEISQVAVVQVLAGRVEEARRTLRRLEDYRKRRYVGADAFAAGHVALGETEEAFAGLERAYRERSFSLVITAVEPMFAALHADPRWARLLARLNLPQAAKVPGR
ncbi:MAG TPA: protein kinase [Vicinamibacterales bacterium]|nr:protein kinase [Vicinamibacterales bacterium]